ncbi:MAG: VWA domain-containing protein, partial [bacterium]|nr:VWA domain-containing protein [bacterium]
MQFLAPAMFGMLGLIPVLILIHLFKPKPKRIEVTNLFLWQEVLKDRGGNVTLRRLVHNLPLWLQILVVLLTALALAHPVRSFMLTQKGNLILVLDSSASMKSSVGSGKTRFDLAQETAFELIDSLEGTQQILIIEAGSQASLVTGFSEQFSQAKKLIEHLSASDAAGTLEEAVFLALSFVSPERDDRVYLISDGAGQDMQTLVNMHPAIEAQLISGGERNIGITKFEFRRDFS